MDRTSFSEKKLPETVPPLRNRYEHLANHQRHRFFDHDLSVIPNRPQSQTRAGLAGNRHDILNIGGFSDKCSHSSARSPSKAWARISGWKRLRKPSWRRCASIFQVAFAAWWRLPEKLWATPAAQAFLSFIRYRRKFSGSF